MIRWWKIPPSLSQAWSRRCNTLPHHSSSRSTLLQEDSTSVTCADRERAHQLGVSSEGGAPFLERDSLQVIGWDFGDSITWVFIVGIWTSYLVHSWGVTMARSSSIGWDGFGEREDDLVIQWFADLGGYTWYLTLKLLPGVCDCLIYHFGEFQKVWRSHSPGPNYLGFRASRGRTIQ